MLESAYGGIAGDLSGVTSNSYEGIYCSHVLKHLSLKDMRTAPANTYRILNPVACSGW